MRHRILGYLTYIDDMLSSDDDRDWEKESRRHLEQIRFFQHERLVHLIVFSLVGICTVLSILAFVLHGDIVLLPLILLFFVLLVPYCRHYYLLENGVQKMYEQYDAMLGKISPYFKRDNYEKNGRRKG